MQVVDKNNKITLSTLLEMSKHMDDDLVKAVVDINKQVMIVDAQMHADQEMFFIEELESDQGDLWGINLYPLDYNTEHFIQFDSMINVRPSWGNRSRGVEDITIQEKIKKIVLELVEKK